MMGIWILLLLIVTAALPAILVFIWFRFRKSPVTLTWFLVSLTAGIISLLAAALVQSFFPREVGGQNGLWAVLFGVFVRVALVEELSRFVTLIPLLKAGRRFRKLPASGAAVTQQDRTFGAALGLVAGLGFAVMENAFYGAANINITLLRAFTAAPLHGACGILAGVSVSVFKQNRVKAVFLFIFAVFIHGAYNLTIISPAFPSVLAILIAYASLFASIHFIKQ